MVMNHAPNFFRMCNCCLQKPYVFSSQIKSHTGENRTKILHKSLHFYSSMRKLNIEKK